VASRIGAAWFPCDHSGVTTVLIVDDHPSFRTAARAALEAEGFDVIGEASDGESAVTAFAVLRPDVVLLDVQLPDCDGFDVAERLKADGAPCVVLTSSRDAADFGPLIRDCGACGFIAKSELCGTAISSLLQ
jgi:two-component system response regulator EvgA